MHANSKYLGTSVLGLTLFTFAVAAPSAFAYDTEPAWVTNSYFKAAAPENEETYINGEWTLNKPGVSGSAFNIDSTQSVFHVTKDGTSEYRKVIQVDCDITFPSYYYLDDITNDVTSSLAALSLVTNETAANSASWMALKDGDTWVNVAATGLSTDLANYKTRIELDYSADQAQVRYSVKVGDSWTVLKEGDTEWFDTAASAEIMSNVCFIGKATLASIDSKLSTTAAAEVNETDYPTLAGALTAAQDGDTVVLYQAATVTPADLRGGIAGKAYTIYQGEGGKALTLNSTTWTSSQKTGVTATYENGVLTVSAEKALVAKIVDGDTDVAYLTLGDAFDAGNGKTVIVITNFAENATLDGTKSVVLDLAEFAISASDAAKPILKVDGSSAQLFVFNGSLTGAGESQAGILVTGGAQVAVDDIAITNNPVAISATGASAVVITNGLFTGAITKADTAVVSILGGYFMDATFAGATASGGKFTHSASNSFAAAGNTIADGYRFTEFAVPYTTNTYSLTCEIVTNVGTSVPTKVWTVKDSSGKESIGGIQITDAWMDANTSGTAAEKQAQLDQSAAYVSKSGAKMKKWEAYVLGMSATETSAGPLVKGVKNTTDNKIAFSLASPAAIQAKESGCDVKFTVTECTSPDLSGAGTESEKADYTGTVELDPPSASDGVRYYKLQMYISTKK